MRFIASIFVLFSLLAPAVQSQEKATTAPVVKLPPQAPNVAAQKFTPDGKVNPGFASSHDKFVKIAQEGTAELVFLGDSITAGWGKNAEIWDKSFSRYKPANFGIGGDRTQHVLWRISNGELDGLKAKAFVLMIGTNNSATDPANGIADGIKVIVETIRQKQPQAKIVLLAVFPRGEKATANAGRDKLIEVNSIISKLHDGKNIYFLDIGSKFLQPDGSLTKDIMPDFLHLSPAGYQIWADAIGPKLAELLAGNAIVTENAVVTETADGKVTLVADGYQFTEGPAVDAQGNVYFTDQPNDRIMKVDTEGAVSEFLKPAGRSNGMFFAPDGKLIACADEKNEMWEIAADKTHKVLFSSFEEKKLNGPNDIWIDANSTMYFTDPYYQRKWWEHKTRPQNKQSVYRVDRDGANVTLVDDTLVQPNGIVGDSKRRLLFVADIGDAKTYQYTIANDGTLVDRKLFCRNGSDGMTIDVEGNLYLTGKKGVTVFNREGKEIQVISVPENWTANVCIGGKDHKNLFITASDSLYSVRVRYAGLSRN